MPTPIIDPSTQIHHNARSPDVPGLNVAYALMEALSNTSASLVKQQVTDTETAVNYGTLQQNLTSWWNSPNGPLQTDINNIAGNPTSGPSIFAKDQAVYQAATGQANSLMNMANAQVTDDSSDISAVNNMTQNSNWMAYLANLLSH